MHKEINNLNFLHYYEYDSISMSILCAINVVNAYPTFPSHNILYI